MVGISSAAKVAAKAAKSSTVRNAATALLGSKTVRSAASEVVSSAAVPIINTKIKERWGKNGEGEEQDAQDVTSEELGTWREPSTLGISSETYSTYLWTQILLLGEYESHLEDYDGEVYEAYVKDFYSQTDDLETHVEVLDTLVDAGEKYLSHLEQYAVRDGDFREYIQSYKTSDVLAKDKPKIFSTEPTPDEAIRALDYQDRLSEYQEYLLDYAEDDPEYRDHIGAYGHPLKTMDVPLEMIVNATIERINYLEEFQSEDGCFDLHCESFDLPNEEYREFLEAENALLRQNT